LFAAVALAPADRQFVYTALQINTDEIRQGQIYDDSPDPAVRAFAHAIHTDASEANQQLIAIADSNGIRVSRAQGAGVPFQATAQPAKLSPNGKERQMNRVPPEQFFQRERAVNEKAIALYEQAASTSQNVELKSYAERTLPVLKRHLADATKGADAERNRKP